MQISEKHAKTLAESGISVEIAAQHGWWSVDAEEAARVLQWTGPPLASGGILMQYPGTDFCRIRFDVPHVGPEGKIWKYMQPVGTDPQLFLPIPTRGQIEDVSVPLAITEGEKKALAAAAQGIPCIGIGGIWSWGRDGELLPVWRQIPLAGREIVLVGDSDLAGRLEGDPAALALPRLADRLYAAGADTVRMIYLPGPDWCQVKKGAQKIGLDDFLAHHGVDALRQVLDGASEVSPESEDAVTAWARRRIHVVVNGLRAGGMTQVQVVEAARPVFERLQAWPAARDEALLALVEAGGGAAARVLRKVGKVVPLRGQVAGGKPWFDSRGFFLPMPLARRVVQEHPMITVHEQIYRYMGGVFRPVKDPDVEALVATYLTEDEYRPHRVAEVVKAIRHITLTPAAEMNKCKDLINVKNGMLDWRTGAIYPHDTKYLSTIQLPVVYDGSADCPQIQKFLADVLRPEDVETVLQFLAYCLIPDTSMQRALMLTGAGANGKSTLLRVFEALIGPENTAHVSLHDLAEQRFAAISLYQKLVNIFADLSAQTISSSSRFKVLTGEDTIYADRKNRDPIAFRSYARLIFSANEVPRSRDRTEAYYRRWIIVDFPRRFGPGEADPRLVEKLTTPEELSGLLNVLLGKLREVMARGQIYISPHAEQNMENFRQRNDNIRAFAADCLAAAPGETVVRKKVYDAYCAYCIAHGTHAAPAAEFYEALEKLGFVQKKDRTGTRVLADCRLIDDTSESADLKF